MTTKWAIGGRFIIPNYDDPTQTYLERTKLLVTPWFAIYLHKINTPDMRPTLHDHPWAFLAIILRGGYVEHVPTDEFWRLRERADGYPLSVNTYTRPRRIRRFNFKRSSGQRGLHYIESLSRTPTWSLVIRGPYARNADGTERRWGYVDRDGRWTLYSEHEHAGSFDEATQVYENQKRAKS